LLNPGYHVLKNLVLDLIRGEFIKSRYSIEVYFIQ
jgi:hypothetical protein